MKTLLLILALVAVASAAEVACKVQYVSATTVYLSAGRSSGIAQGDSVVISRNGTELARVVISFVAENSSSCEFPAAVTTIAKDDAATVFVAEAIEEQSSAPAEETASFPIVPEQSSATKPAPGDRPNDLSGRIGVDYTVQDDREPVNYDYTQPALSVRATLRRISGSDFTARANLRLRRTIRANDELTSSSNRIYEAMLAYEPTDKPIEAGVGRLILRETRGMGYLDGGYVKYDLSNKLKIGAVGGIEPDLENTRIQSDFTKAGAFVAFEQRLNEAQSLQATASLAGRYLEGEVSREFFYQQLSFIHSSKLRLFESTEINLNRDWLKDAEGSTVTLASILLDARYSFARAFAVSLGYDNRQPYYTAETRTIPDSIFNSAQQQGYRAGVESRFGESYSADAGIGIRDGNDQQSQATSGWVRVGSSNLAESQISTYARLRWFDSDLSNGIQPSLNVSRVMAEWLTTGLEVGMNDYELVSTSEQVSQQWFAILLDLTPAKQTYISADFEQGFGDGHDATVITLSLGYRF